MKVFAILTASLMAAGSAAYFLQDSCSPCYHTGNCPVAKTGGCCSGDYDQPSSCSLPCSVSANPDCCATVCELCCTDAVQVTVSQQVATEEETCCALCNSPARLAIGAVTASASLK
jgi:hypothetical protein